MTHERMIQAVNPIKPDTSRQWQHEPEASDVKPLNVHHPDDRYEQEARQTADNLSFISQPSSIIPGSNNTSDITPVKPSLAKDIASRKGSGQRLPDDVRQSFGKRFRYDFSRVRVYHDASSNQMAHGLGARAFTHGQNIYFAHGQYQPQQQHGQKVLAHELVHTIQQGNHTEHIQRLEDERSSDPIQVARDEDSPTPALPSQSTADVIVAAIRSGGTGNRGRIARQLAMIPPTERQLVLRLVRSQLSPPELAILDDIVRDVRSADEAIEQETTSLEELAAQEATSTSAGTSLERRQADQRAEVQARETQAQMQEPQATVTEQASEELQTQQEQNTGETEQTTEETQESAEGQSEEAGEASERDTEEAQENADSEQAEIGGDDSEAMSLFDLVEEPEAGPEPASLEEAEAELGNYDADAARAEAQTAATNIRASGDNAVAQIQNAVGASREQLTATADAARQQVAAQVEAHVATINTTYGAKRTEIENSYNALLETITAEHEARQNTLTTSGDTAHTDMSDLFSTHRENVSTTVNEKVDTVETLRTTKEQTVRNRTQQDAQRARDMGQTQAQGYSNSERGRVQAEAATGVAERTAREIEENEPEAIEAVQDITEDLPNEIRDKGEEALDGFDNGLPDMQQQISDYATAVSGQFTTQYNSAREQIETNKGALLIQLTIAQAAAIASAIALIPQAETQIQAALQNALSALETGPPQAIQRINQTVNEATTLLTQPETPDPQAVHEIEAQVLSFVSDASSDAIGSMETGISRINTEFSTLVQTNAEGIITAQQAMNEDLQTLTDQANSTLTQIESAVMEGFDTTAQAFDDGIAEALGQVETQLSTEIAQLAGDMQTPIDEAEAEIDEAIDEGFAKNAEALGDLPGQMREAASDAAWDYDHPILSTVADVASFIAGAIVAILAVIALVVIVIVAFKLIIAGLVALGISLVVAKIIVAVAAVALLAYGIYSAYQETGSLGGAIMRLTGIENIVTAFTAEGLSPFQRGMQFGQGVATVATFFIGRGMGRSVNARFARFGRMPNPSGRAARLLRFIENPRSLSRTGRRLFIRGGGRRLDLALRGGRDRLGALAESLGQSRIGRGLSAASERFGQSRLGRGLRSTGERIDSAVEGAFQRVEGSRPGQAVRRFLFGEPTAPAPASTATPTPVAAPAAARPPTPARRPIAARAANDNAIPTTRQPVSQPQVPRPAQPSNVRQLPRPGESGGPTPAGQAARQPRDADVIPIGRARRGAPRPAEPPTEPARQVAPQPVVREATTGQPISQLPRTSRPATSPMAGDANRPRAMASGSSRSGSGGGSQPPRTAPQAPRSTASGAGRDSRGRVSSETRQSSSQSEQPTSTSTQDRGGEISSMGTRPRRGSRTQTREEWKARDRARRMGTRRSMGERVSEADLSQGELNMVQQARSARQSIGSVPSGKTGARASGGDRTLSGWAEQPGFEQRTQQVMQESQRMGHRPNPNRLLDQGVRGRYHSSHAEKQASVASPNQPIGVSRPMCSDCVRYFQTHARSSGYTQVVSDPNTTRIFHPDGTILIVD